MRKISFGDLANGAVQGTVVRLIQSAMPGALLPDDAWVAKLSSGSLEAYWVLDEDGVPAGVAAFEVGRLPEDGRRCLYVVAAAVAPHVSEAGWLRLLGFGRLLARERGCVALQFDTSAENGRMAEVGRLFGAVEEPIRLATEAPGLRYTVEV